MSITFRKVDFSKIEPLLDQVDMNVENLPGSNWIGAYNHEMLVGFGMIILDNTPPPPKYISRWTYVIPSHRGKGLYEGLINARLDFCKGRGGRQLTICQPLPRLVSRLIKLGFKEVNGEVTKTI